MERESPFSLISVNNYCYLIKQNENKRITLGDKVKDLVSGFTGIATARHTYLNRCDRVTVQPAYISKEGKLPGSCTFDEPQLKVLKAKVVAQGSKLTGGPDKFIDEGR